MQVRFIYLVRSGKDVVNSFYNHLSHMAVDDGGYEGDYEKFVSDCTSRMPQSLFCMSWCPDFEFRGT